ncbi:MAG: fatty acid desaturase, partial [Candidatus Dojkabacteria bacterium]|nr:fatty acid desaturase [Candidatus Dojkabacteria bacterium]
RYFSHKSFKTKRIYKLLGLFFGSFNLSGPVIPWVAVHREHHRYADTENDPHNPTLKGKIFVHFFPYFYIPNLSYAKDLLLDKDCILQNKYYFLFHFSILSLLFVVPFEWMFSFLFCPFVLTWNIGNLTNSFLHKEHGPINNKVLSFLIGGEGSHENHHKFPKRDCFNDKIFYDLGYWLFINHIKTK